MPPGDGPGRALPGMYSKPLTMNGESATGPESLPLLLLLLLLDELMDLQSAHDSDGRGNGSGARIKKQLKPASSNLTSKGGSIWLCYLVEVSTKPYYWKGGLKCVKQFQVKFCSIVPVGENIVEARQFFNRPNSRRERVTLAYSVCTLSVEAINGSLLPMRDRDGLVVYSMQMK